MGSRSGCGGSVLRLLLGLGCEFFLACSLVFGGELPNEIGTALCPIGTAEQLFAQLGIDRSPMFREMGHQHRAFLHRAYGVPYRLLGDLAQFGKQAVGGESVTRMAPEPQRMFVAKMQQRSTTYGTGKNLRVAEIANGYSGLPFGHLDLQSHCLLHLVVSNIPVGGFGPGQSLQQSSELARQHTMVDRHIVESASRHGA